MRLKKNNIEKKRCYVTIGDKSQHSIVISMWGDLCDKITNKLITPGNIIAVKSAKVSEYGGRSLNVASDTSELFIEPQHPKSLELREWF